MQADGQDEASLLSDSITKLLSLGTSQCRACWEQKKKKILHGVGNPPSSPPLGLNSLLRVFELFFPFQVCLMILGILGQVPLCLMLYLSGSSWIIPALSKEQALMCQA